VASIEKRGKNLFRLVLEAGYDAYGKRIKRSESIKLMALEKLKKN
jgi:integrase